MRIDVLGPIRVTGSRSIELTRPSHRRLLAIFALEAGQLVTTDRLIDRFWPAGPPATAKAAIHTHISALREAIDPSIIRTERDGYRLATEGLVLDADVFVALAADATATVRDQRWEQALRLVDEALLLWRGSPFHELRDDDYVKPIEVRLVETRLELYELRAEILLALGRPGDALPELESLVVEHQVRERLWEHLMTARYRMGRHREALAAFREASRHLVEIGLEPGPALQRLEERILLHDRNLTQTSHNLPEELDTFINRDMEMRQVANLIAESRLVTLTGAGGSGKTRLAVRTAKGLFDRFPDGIWLVGLEGLDEPRLVATEVAIAMGLRPQGDDALAAVIETIGGTNALVILDNCEHVLEGASRFVAGLLESSPNVRVLTTSRAPLRVAGEVHFPIQGMKVPSSSVSVADAAASEAVRLFIARASQSNPTQLIDMEDIPAVVSICTRLDGLPLALELAAARMSSMTLSALAHGLEDATDLLTSGSMVGDQRQQTLAATVEWSYRLLSDLEKTVFAQLSVFRGGFDLDLVDAVVAAGDVEASRLRATVLDLVESSLVEPYRTSPKSRYRLLEPLRQFAYDRLGEADSGQTRDRHLESFVGLFRDVWVEAIATDRAAVTLALAHEVENLQFALEWARQNEDGAATSKLSQALAWHWYLSGHLGNAVEALTDGLGHAADDEESVLIRSLLARCLAYSEDIETANVEAELAVAGLSAVESDLLAAWVISTVQLTLFMSVTSDPARMLQLAEQALGLAENTSDAHSEVIARQVVADAYCWNGRTAAGLEQQRSVLSRAADTGNPSVIDYAYGQSIYNFMLDPSERTAQPGRVIEEWIEKIGLEEPNWTSAAIDWLPWIYMQTGNLARAEEAAGRLGDRTLEGYNRTINLIVQSSLAWIKGDLRAALEAIVKLNEKAVSERWWHVFYPLAVEIAVDSGNLDEAAEFASTYISLAVHPTREATKLGALTPMVRVHVDEAIRTGSPEAARSARETSDHMSRIVSENPPLVDGWTSIMTHQQNLAFARAELSRLADPDPGLWAEALQMADHAYYQLYARWRLAEAKMTAGHLEEGTNDLVLAEDAAKTMGARLMLRRVRDTAKSRGMSISAFSPTSSHRHQSST